MNRWSIRLLAVGFALASFGVGAADRPIATLSSGGSGLTNAPSLARGGGRLAIASHARGSAGLVAEVALFDDATGAQLARVPLSSGASLAANPKVAASDKGFGAAWFDDEGGTSRIRFAAIDPNGAITVPSLPVSDGAGSAFDPVVVRGGGEWGIFWFQLAAGGSAIHFASVSDDGRLLVGPKRLTDPPLWGHYPSAAYVDGRYGVAWHSRNDNRFEVRFRTFDRNGDPSGGEQRLDVADGGAWYPSVAVARGEFAVAWHELASGSFGISFRRLALDGMPLAAPMHLEEAGSVPMFPSLAASTDGWLLAWTDRGSGTPRSALRMLGASPVPGPVSPDCSLGGSAGIRAEFARALPDGRGALVVMTTMEEGRESIRLEKVDLSASEVAR